MNTQVDFLNLHIHSQTMFSTDTKDMGLPMMSAHPLAPSRTMNYLPYTRGREVWPKNISISYKNYEIQQ
jgi:hypothetical protein